MENRDVFVLIFSLIVGFLIFSTLGFTILLSVTTPSFSFDNDALIINLSFLSLVTQILLTLSIFFVGIAYYVKSDSGKI